MRSMVRASGVVAAAWLGMECHSALRWMDVDVQFALAGIAGYVGGALAAAAVDFAWEALHARAGTKAGAGEKKRGGGGPA